MRSDRNTAECTRSNRARLLGRRCVILILAVLPLTLGADPADRAVIEQNRERIERMTAAERSRLEYLFEKYEQLGDAERERLRALHAAIGKDSQAGGDLRATMEQYRAWLKSLAPWQRDELRNAPDSDARLKLVRKFKDEQEQRQLARSVISPEPRQPGERPWMLPGRVAPEELDAMIAVLQERTALAADAAAEIEALPPAHRHLRVLTAVLGAAAARPGASSRWLDEPTVEALAAVMTSPRLQSLLEGTDQADRRRFFVGTLLISGVMREAETELDRRRPSDDQLEELFLQLDPEQQVEISKLPREAGKRRLTYLYFQNSRDPFARDVGELRQTLDQLFRRDGPRRSGSRGRDDSRGNRSNGPRTPRRAPDTPAPQ